MRKSVLILAVVTVALVGFIPFKSTVVPQWKVTVVDEHGKPYRNHEIVQTCESYAYSEDPCGADAPERVKFTDENGAVTFPERVITLNLWTRLYRLVKNILLLAAHGSMGRDAYLSTSGPHGYAQIEYRGGTPPSVFKIDRMPE